MSERGVCVSERCACVSERGVCMCTKEVHVYALMPVCAIEMYICINRYLYRAYVFF